MAVGRGAGRYRVMAVNSGAVRRGPLPGVAVAVAARWLVIPLGSMLVPSFSLRFVRTCPAAVLFMPVPSGVAMCPGSRSPLALASSAFSSSTPFSSTTPR